MDNFPLFSFGKKDDIETKRLLLSSLKALRDGENLSVVSSNLQGVDREIVDVLNEIIAKHHACGNEMARVASEVAAGRDATVKIENMRGSWANIVGSMNTVLQIHSEQIHQFNRVTGAIANGDFSKKITVDMKGEALELKDTINTFVDNINVFASEVSRLTYDIALQGKFGGQADVRQVSGSWKDLTENINLMSTNISEQVGEVKRITTLVTKGNFSKKVTMDAKGEMLDFKDTLNAFVDDLNWFATETSRVFHACGEGRFGDTVQNSDQYVEGAWLDILANVNSMSVQAADKSRTVFNSLQGVSELKSKPTNLVELKIAVDQIVQLLQTRANASTIYNSPRDAVRPCVTKVSDAKILLVVDDSANQQVFTRMLVERLGYPNVTAVKSEAEATTKVEQEAFDLIFLFNLPNKVISIPLRELTNRRIPVLGVFQHEIATSGIDDQLVAPIYLPQVKLMLEKHLKKSGKVQQAARETRDDELNDEDFEALEEFVLVDGK